MIELLHSFNPQSVLFSAGSLTVYWYGFLIVLGIVAALLISLSLAKEYGLTTDLVFDLSFWLIIWGLLGARIYEIFLMFPYYISNPGQMIRVWEGGLAIHGAIIGGLLVIFTFSRRRRLNFWQLSSLFVPGIAVGQAIGRWGNYFNQELFGLPTKLPWGIPISPINRPADYIFETYFHPTFLYESLGCLTIAILLLTFSAWAIKKNYLNYRFYLWSTALYVILYSSLRFSLEFIRLDETPIILGWRWPQLASLLMIIGASILIILKENGLQKNSKK